MGLSINYVTLEGGRRVFRKSYDALGGYKRYVTEIFIKFNDSDIY